MLENMLKTHDLSASWQLRAVVGAGLGITSTASSRGTISVGAGLWI